jgi:hypothetical protein
MQASGLKDAQPCRLGTALNTFGPVWRSMNTLFGFARQDDGTLELHAIDPPSGAVHDLGVRLPARPNFQRSEQKLIPKESRSALSSVYVPVRRTSSRSKARCCSGVGCVNAMKAA